MKIKKQIERKYSEEIVEFTICDVCKHKFVGEKWGVGYYDVAETIIKMRIGKSYPEGSHGEEISLDVCPNCFEEKLIPLLETIGVIPNYTEWD